MAKTSSEIEVRITGKDELSPQFQQLESRLIRIVGAFGAGIAALRVGSAPIIAAADFERELANVKKTTNFLTRDIDKLGASLLKMSTKIDVSALDLAKIAAAAGQQGLGREGVEGVTQFTESVARMASVLDLTSEQAAEDIGKIANIFKIPLRDIEEAVSTFNEVSNNSTAKGEELLDVVKRIGDAAGNLNLQQSVALAATGLDFGQSPEVVGTAFAKVFTSLTQKADAFGRLLYGNMAGATDQWLNLLETDGLKAFQAVLAEMRKLQPQAQQNAIVKLFGGGRIGALINKLVQDITDSVLERNFASAITGKGGLSAIREQATVLNTFKAQATLTLNALTKAGIDAANQLLPPLTEYVTRLRAALESPGLVSFFNALAQALNQTIALFVRAVEVVASLNVNWENFILVAKVFVGLSVAKAILALTGRITGLSAGLKSISNDALVARASIASLTTATGAAGASTRFSKAWFAELIGYNQLYEAILRNKKAKQDAAAAEAAQIRNANKTAQTSFIVADAAAATRAAAVATKARVDDVRNARTAVYRAQQQEATATVALQASKNQRVQAAESAHQTRLAAIEQSYQTRRAAIRATGTQTGLKALRAEKAAQLEAEAATHARSLTSTAAYWDRRILQAAAGAKAAVEAERLAYMQAVGKFDGQLNILSRNKERLGTVGGASAAATAGGFATLVQKEAQIVAASKATQAAATATTVTMAQRLMVVVGAITTFGATALNVVKTIGTGFIWLASKAAWLLSIGVILYSVADSLGWISKGLDALQGFTDWLGITSAQDRKDALMREQRKKAIKEERDEILRLAEAYDNLKNRTTPKEFSQEVTALAVKLSTSETQGGRDAALKDLLGLAGAATARLAEDTKKLDARIKASITDTEKQASAALARFNELQAQLNKELTATPDAAGPIRARLQPQIEAATREYARLTQALEDARKEAGPFQSSLTRVSEDAAIIKSSIQGMFSPQSASLLLEYGGGLNVIYEQIRQLRIAHQQLRENAGPGQENAVNQAGNELQKQIEDLQAKATAAQEGLKKAIAVVIATPGLSEKIKESMKDLLVLVQLPAQEYAKVAAALQGATPTELTAKYAGANSGGGASGKGLFDPKLTGEESLARRMSKARLAIAKAENEASANLTEEYFRQQQAAEDDAFRNGLRSFQDYYENRGRIQTAAIDAEIKQRQGDIKATEFEKTKPGLDKAQKLSLDAELIRLNGQIAALQARKEGIAADTGRLIENESRSFTQVISEQTAKLQEVGLLPDDVVSKFSTNIALLREKAAIELATLRARGQTAIADALEKSLFGDAAEKVFKQESSNASLAFSELDAVRSKINALREAGAITSAEADAQITNAIRLTIPVFETLIARQQDVLNGMVLMGQQGTPQYRQLVVDLEKAKQSMFNLGQETNSTARSINQGVSGALESALVEARYNMGGIDDFALDLAQKVRASLKEAFAKNLSDVISEALGLKGDGGIGGAIASLFGAGSSRKPTGTPTDPVYTAQSPGDFGPPVWTPDKENKGIFDQAGAKISEWAGTLKTGTSTLWEGIKENFSKWSDALGTFLGGMWEAAKNVDWGAVGTWVSTLFHSGGIVGSGGSSRRMSVSPALFANAYKFHSGGVAGLRPDEVPIIAKKGEEVLTQSDPRHRDNMGTDTTTGGKMLNIWIVSPDQQPSMGPNDIVTVVNDNISRNGSIKKMIQQVQLGR